MKEFISGKIRLRQKIRVYLWVIIIIWTLVVALSLLWNITQIKNNTLTEAFTDATMASHKDILYRQWASGHGGVYVPVTPGNPPNPYLAQIPERDITTPSGRKLTLVNPAYMSRQVYELDAAQSGLIGRLTSPNPINPKNAPDEWEQKAFSHIRAGEKEFSSVEKLQGKRYFRFMSPFYVDKQCLSCHARYGFKEGDLRGGISIAINIEPLMARAGKRIGTIALSHILLWAIALTAILIGYRNLQFEEQKRLVAEMEKEKLIADLRGSLDKIETLSGLLPICASCKKIRNDKGYWEQIEKYIGERTAAEFTHGICPECKSKLYPELDQK